MKIGQQGAVKCLSLEPSVQIQGKTLTISSLPGNRIIKNFFFEKKGFLKAKSL